MIYDQLTFLVKYYYSESLIKMSELVAEVDLMKIGNNAKEFAEKEAEKTVNEGEDEDDDDENEGDEEAEGGGEKKKKKKKKKKPKKKKAAALCAEPCQPQAHRLLNGKWHKTQVTTTRIYMTRTHMYMHRTHTHST